MKLILSSSDFINENSKQVILDNIDNELSDNKVLFIPNEKATKDKINSEIRNYAKRQADLLNEIKEEIKNGGLI